MEGNLKIQSLKNSVFRMESSKIFFSYHSLAKWTKEQGNSGDGSCDDPLKESP
jgi:hypothetical protein